MGKKPRQLNFVNLGFVIHLSEYWVKSKNADERGSISAPYC